MSNNSKVSYVKLYTEITIFTLMFNLGVFVMSQKLDNITSALISTAGLLGTAVPFVSFVGFIDTGLDLVTLSLMSVPILIFSTIQTVIIVLIIADYVSETA